jgi:hypothetical protein
MKKIIIGLLFVVLIVVSLYSQDNRNNSLQITPPHFTNMSFSIAYQRALNNFFNLETAISFSETMKQSYDLGADIGLMYRPFGHRLMGLYVNLAQGIDLNIIDTIDNTIIHVPTELGVGYQWIFMYGITLSLGGGIVKLNRISNNSIEIDGIEFTFSEFSDELEFYNDYNIHIRLGIGYSW